MNRIAVVTGADLGVVAEALDTNLVFFRDGAPVLF